MQQSSINPWDWQDQFGFSQAWRIEGPGTVIEISGQTAMSSEGTVQHEDDFRGQTRLVFENLKTVLAEAGAEPADVVKLGAYLTDEQYVEDYAVIQQEFFPGENPAQTLLVVDGLALPGLMVEVEATAYVD